MSSKLGELLQTFITRHPRLSGSSVIVAPPKSDRNTPDLAGQWAQGIAKSLTWDLLQAHKLRQTDPQKDLDEGDTEDTAAARVANSIGVPALEARARVLIVDDTMRSGGTMNELARALREAGANEVFGLCVTKDAKFTQGGIDLSREQWQ